MTDLSLTKTSLQGGIWQGIIAGSASKPNLVMTHLDQSVGGFLIAPGADAESWSVQIKIPSDVIGDGVQTLLISDADSDTVLDRVTLIAGEALGEDLRAEVDLLRAELDMLKRAFRRHCTETA